MIGSVPPLAQVLRGTPVAGEIEDVLRIRGFLADVRADAAFFTTSVFAAASELDALESVAVGRLRLRVLDGSVAGANDLTESVVRAEAAVRRYADAAAGIHRAADSLREEAAEQLEVIRGAMTRLEQIAAALEAAFDAAWRVPPPPTLPGPPPMAAPWGNGDGLGAFTGPPHEALRAQWVDAVTRWERALADVEHASARWDTLIADRRAAEAELSRALGDTPIGQLATLGTGLAGGRTRAIAVGLTGELGGEAAIAGSLRTAHPLLTQLLGTADGAHVWEHPPPPDTIQHGWERLTKSEQEQLITEVPWVIGNLPGLLPSIRDRANRGALDFFREHPQLMDTGQLALAAGLHRILNTASGQALPHPPTQLLALDLGAEPPKAAVGYGDLDTASHLTFQVPGMNSDAPDALPSWDTAARNLFDAQELALRRAATHSAAVVSWLGYDTPGPLPDLAVLRTEHATLGAPRLAAEVDGMHVARAASAAGAAVTSLVAHSYGTTLAALALRDTTHPIDACVMLGSAGLDTTAVPAISTLNVRELAPGQPAVFATNATNDRLAPLGAAMASRGLPTPNGRAPLGIHYHASVYGGVISFAADGDPARDLKRTDGHSITGSGSTPGPLGITASTGHGYGDAKTEALNSTAEVTTQTVSVETAATFMVTTELTVTRYADPATGAETHWRMPHNATH